jgi:DNA-directed RNA polymerase subunit N (RpoN/RPB10)
MREDTMNFFKNLFSSRSSTGAFHDFSVRCKRCGEIIHGRINVYNEPGMEINEKGITYYTCRKVLIGNQHCFQQVEVIFDFDEQRKVIGKRIFNGEFIES